MIATSSGAAAAYVREGYTNMRAGMLLEVATTIGALAGATLAAQCPRAGSRCSSASCSSYSAYLARRAPNGRPDGAPPTRGAIALRLDSTYPTPTGMQATACSMCPAASG